jgi:zinc/manganese transport system substrate-binding protein
MRTTVQSALALGFSLAFTIGALGQKTKLSVVAAENFYGDVAEQIGGDLVEVASILNNPNQDPHLFETTSTVVRQISAAQVVIYNGADYDVWMENLLKAAPRAERTVVAVAQLVNRNAGDNPHLWYVPSTMPTVARALADAFSRTDPAHSADYTARLQTFIGSLNRISRKIEEIRAKYAGVAITATEPVFGYTASALGLNGGCRPVGQ